MEFDEKLSSLFLHLSNSLSEGNVQSIDFSMRVNNEHRWPTLQEPLTGRAVLMTMKELGMWTVDQRCRECNLLFLINRLDMIGRKDLAAKVVEFGKLYHLMRHFAACTARSMIGSWHHHVVRPSVRL